MLNMQRKRQTAKEVVLVLVLGLVSLLQTLQDRSVARQLFTKDEEDNDHNKKECQIDETKCKVYYPFKLGDGYCNGGD